MTCGIDIVPQCDTILKYILNAFKSNKIHISSKWRSNSKWRDLINSYLEWQNIKFKRK